MDDRRRQQRWKRTNGDRKILMREDVNVLIMGAGCGPAISIIKNLNQAWIHRYGSDIDDTAAGLYLCDDYFTTPRADDPRFADFVLDACKKRSISIIFCPLDVDVLELSSHKERFEKEGIHILCAPHQNIQRCLNKSAANLFCEHNDILTPRTWENFVPKTLYEGYHLIVKPSFGCGAKGHQIIKHFSEFNRNRMDGDFICQEFIEGNEYSIDVLCDDQGPIYAVPRHRVLVKNGQMVKGKAVNDKELVDYAMSVVSKFEITGASCLQCIRNNDGIYFIELNPRYGTGIDLTCEAGINMPEMQIDMVEGRLIDKNIKIKEKFISRYWSNIVL